MYMLFIVVFLRCYSFLLLSYFFHLVSTSYIFFFFFFFNVTATTEIYTYCHTLSLHDALPISLGQQDAVVVLVERGEVRGVLGDLPQRAHVRDAECALAGLGHGDQAGRAQRAGGHLGGPAAAQRAVAESV